MQRRTISLPPLHLYPTDPWAIVEARFSRDHLARAETIFALANGFLGIRGTFEEARPSFSPGTFINGFHETWPIVHAEEAFGLAKTGQTMLNVPDATVLKLYVDDEPLYLPVARLPEYRRVLDMRAGTLERHLLWSTPSGKHVRIRSTRLVSFEHRHLAAIRYEVSVEDHPASLTLASQIVNRQDAATSELHAATSTDPRRGRTFADRVLNPLVEDGDDLRLLLGYRTTDSGMSLGIGVDHVVQTPMSWRHEAAVDGDLSEVVFMGDAEPGETLSVTKFVTYQTSRSVDPSELTTRCRRTLDRAVANGFDELVTTQRSQLDRFWDRADIEVEADGQTSRIQQAVRWNLFQLAQASWRAEGSGIPAKGLTGSAYEGHYFWDTEVYVLPFLAYTQPRIARNLLRFRHGMLDRARSWASALSHRGAMFPWRTINGEEASAYFQAGTAQYHINADIAHAIRRYLDIRGDIGFLVEVGAEILIETARMWEDLGFVGNDGCFHIHGVTGPDEYTTVVNDNAYTNLMARLNLNYAAHAVRLLQAERPDEYAALAIEVGLEEGEVAAWEQAATNMYVPYDQTRAIVPQDETFLDREIWPFEDTPAEKYPLLLHFHPLTIYRFQVLKQADVVLAMFLLGNEFTTEQKRANFDYYDPLTTGDSSLSASVQSIVAAEIGDEVRALRYFRHALLMDLADVAGNSSDGVHVASNGGVWMALVFGFGGVRDFDGDLRFDPHLPGSWPRLRFSLRFRNRQLRVTLRHDREEYLMDEGESLEVTIRDERHKLEVGAPVIVTPPVRTEAARSG